MVIVYNYPLWNGKITTIKDLSMRASNNSTIPQTIQIAKRYLHLVTQDSGLANTLEHQINHFGYSIRIVNGIHELENAITEHGSIAFLVDMDTIEPSLGEIKLADAIKSLRSFEIPLIFLSDLNNQAVRLKAVRAGGKAFFPKPVDVISLIDKLDDQDAYKASDNPYRVLVVEDQIAVANYYHMVLRMGGMDARVVTDPTLVLENLLDFHPDLILLDLYMSIVDGAELAILIRQMDEFVSIPIIFLSSEDDFDKHIEMMRLGSDDFLTKPIKATHLVEIVRNRLERLKTLRTYMVRDCLTGLLNHTSFRGILSQEVNRCKRQGARIALSMIDVDLFKHVNDTYGHAAGDSVLKGLSRLLKQYLRKSDIIGRYGGEEFVALLLDAGPDEAFTIMDELRMNFSEIKFVPVPGKELSVTFSGGIATFPEFSTAKELSDAADVAMYQAKAAGRNQLVLATPSTEYK
jgi:diguanylate cyclase (GGDEF)-like protein